MVTSHIVKVEITLFASTSFSSSGHPNIGQEICREGAKEIEIGEGGDLGMKVREEARSTWKEMKRVNKL